VEHISEPTAELAIEVAAPAADVWRVVSHVTRIPVRGHNKLNGARKAIVEGDRPG
jgi:hypothetical protein